MSKRLVVFNHKGGVSKTTTVYNLGWMLAKKFKVLVVDGDSQCNLTSLILGESFEKYYIDDDTKNQNIKDGVAPAFQGKPVPIQAVNCFSPQRAPSMFLLAGHANLTEFDAALTFAQNSNNALATLQNLPGAFAELLRLTEAKYSIDYTIIDINPSLSSINQNLFLAADAFLVPTNPDPFSLMALDTLQNMLPKWVAWKRSAVPLFADSAYALTVGTPKFTGSIIQRFNIRNGRAARPYRNNIEEIKAKLGGSFYAAMEANGMTFDSGVYGADLVNDDFCLSEIPDFQGLLPKSHEIGVPIFEIQDDEIEETGPVKANMKERRDTFFSMFDKLATKINIFLDNA